MLAWRDQHQAILAVGKHLQVLGRHVPGEDADIGQPLAQGAQGVTADALLQVDLHFRMLAGKGAQVFGQELDHRRGVGVDAHMALHALAELAEVSVQLLQVVQQVARVVQQRVAGRCQLDALGLAIEQADTKLPFQIADALAHRRQRQMLALGGAGQAAGLGDGDEQPKGDEIDAAHGQASVFAGDEACTYSRRYSKAPRLQASWSAKPCLANDQLSAANGSVMLGTMNQPAQVS